MCQLLESIRIENGHALNIDLHQKRMNRSIQELFGMKNTIDLSEILNSHNSPLSGIYKCRILYDTESYNVDFCKYSPKFISSLKLVSNDSISYSYKYASRDCFKDLLSFKENCDDIIIVKNGFVTDASYANLIFFDGDKWYTPRTPLLYGTQREYLLSVNKIFEVDIPSNNIDNYKKVALINAMLDFKSKIELDTGKIVD